jgi:tetratricopeptide (TPR) repeat protein
MVIKAAGDLGLARTLVPENPETRTIREEAEGSARDVQARAAYQQGCYLASKGDRRGAARAFAEAADLLPEAGEYLLAAGEAALGIGDHDGACQFLTQALERTPGDGHTNALLARAHLMAGRAPFAYGLALRGLSDSPDHPELLDVLRASEEG